MLSEIGSNFWISPEEIQGESNLGTPEQFGCIGSDYVWMSTGRSATRIVLKTILERQPTLKKVALIPAFTCHTVIEPFIELEFEIHTLPMSLNLETSASDITGALTESGATILLVHRFYGFDTLPEFNQTIVDIRKQGVVVIEDCTQCLYSTFVKSEADYYVGSVRKWCGVPDGGFAVCREGTFLNKPKCSDDALEIAKREASELKYAYMFRGKDCKPESKKRYREAEHILDTQSSFYAIGKLSALIQTNLDRNRLRNKRRENYSILANGLRNHSDIRLVFKELPEDVIPLYLPVFVRNRDEVQSRLADNAVYAPVVWPKADCCPYVCPEADELYNHLLCIPIDQRYDTDDMKRILNLLLQQ